MNLQNEQEIDRYSINYSHIEVSVYAFCLPGYNPYLVTSYRKGIVCSEYQVHTLVIVFARKQPFEGFQ